MLHGSSGGVMMGFKDWPAGAAVQLEGMLDIRLVCPLLEFRACAIVSHCACSVIQLALCLGAQTQLVYAGLTLYT
jgi:hypothetical protein